MVTRVVEFAPTSDAAAEFVGIIQGTALRIVRQQAGCIAAFVQVHQQVVLGLSVWRSAADAERCSRECYPDIEQMLRGFLKCNPKVYTFHSRNIESVRARMLQHRSGRRTVSDYGLESAG